MRLDVFNSEFELLGSVDMNIPDGDLGIAIPYNTGKMRISSDGRYGSSFGTFTLRRVHLADGLEYIDCGNVGIELIRRISTYEEPHLRPAYKPYR